MEERGCGCGEGEYGDADAELGGVYVVGWERGSVYKAHLTQYIKSTPPQISLIKAPLPPKSTTSSPLPPKPYFQNQVLVTAGEEFFLFSMQILQAKHAFMQRVGGCCGFISWYNFPAEPFSRYLQFLPSRWKDSWYRRVISG